ncbi:MAG TPA: tetratricopeptide repeat protein [Bryobacteraceae bacterium]|nr:tetratricopeptide repeat protein [Bryobacteraceae bacterium]
MKLFLLGALAAAVAAGQSSQQLAESGHCREALPLLKAELAKATAADVQKRLGVDGVRCGMTLDDLDATLDFLRGLNRNFPGDAEVLYLSVHVFSDLSIRSSHKLMVSAPTAYQVHELNAEALETQGKWSDAEAEYREVLKRDPQLPGIHYRIARLLLSAPPDTPVNGDAQAAPPDVKGAARRELEEELKIDPNNAGAEYVLGELARQEGKDAAAIDHFSRATKLDAGFADAFIGLGRTFLTDNRAADAIQPLETAIKLDPGSPIAHFSLATAYSRAGRKADAQREFKLLKETSEKLEQTKQQVRQGIAGAPPQP